MDKQDIQTAQALIDKLSVGEKRCLKEIYGDEWSSVRNPTAFGKMFKEAVLAKQLRNIRHLGIRKTGRCDEYQKI
jgi:hypothetical protein